VTRGCVFRSKAQWLAAAAALAISLSAKPAQAHGPWVVLKDCRLIANESNDADSFHVKAGGKEYLFRVYFADAPETDDSFPERVEEQAKYFGIKPQQTTLLGDYAKRFTREKLSGSFTVRTCMQEALGRSNLQRYYAFIETKDGDLAELLVANGLARVHGSAATPAGLSSPEREWRKLQRLEREAKVQKVGGWGAGSGRMTARLPRQPAKSGADSFDAFFHPERLATAAETEEVTSAMALSTPAARTNPLVTATTATNLPAAAEAKLDVNSASAEELRKIPGIGPVLAQRIIEARPFTSADELRKVKGIGAKTYEKIRPSFL
jgi:competence ComEA-like helix-hairpin-helix protein